LNELHELLERMCENIVSLLEGYDLRSVYKAVMYLLACSALASSRHDDCRLAEPLKEGVPPPLLAAARRELYYLFLELLRLIEGLLMSKRPVVIEGEADLRFVVSWLRHEVERVDHVLIYDCMSIPEFLVIAAHLRSRGLRTSFLSKALLNPVGLTSFVTQQLREMNRREALREVARLIAENLGGVGYHKSSYPDAMVHEYGPLGVEEFVKSMNVNYVAEEVLSYAAAGRLLVGTDHGYDLVVGEGGRYIYVVHGFRASDTHKGTLLLPLSRIALFMVVYR